MPDQSGLLHLSPPSCIWSWTRQVALNGVKAGDRGEDELRICLIGPIDVPDLMEDLAWADEAEKVPAGHPGSWPTSLAKALLDRGHHLHIITTDARSRHVWRAESVSASVVVVPIRRH